MRERGKTFKEHLRDLFPGLYRLFQYLFYISILIFFILAPAILTYLLIHKYQFKSNPQDDFKFKLKLSFAAIPLCFILISEYRNTVIGIITIFINLIRVFLE